MSRDAHISLKTTTDGSGSDIGRMVHAPLIKEWHILTYTGTWEHMVGDNIMSMALSIKTISFFNT